jgi:hypothetical protein
MSPTEPKILARRLLDASVIAGVSLSVVDCFASFTRNLGHGAVGALWVIVLLVSTALVLATFVFLATVVSVRLDSVLQGWPGLALSIYPRFC